MYICIYVQVHVHVHVHVHVYVYVYVVFKAPAAYNPCYRTLISDPLPQPHRTTAPTLNRWVQGLRL